MKMLTNEQIRELNLLERFACQNGHYKITSQCENTISSALKSSINSNSLQILKFGGGGGGREGLGGGGALPPCHPPLATALRSTVYCSVCESTMPTLL